jgi:hypothetical protein
MFFSFRFKMEFWILAILAAVVMTMFAFIILFVVYVSSVDKKGKRDDGGHNDERD